jgi:putative transposase
LWSARCLERGTPGAGSGPQKRTGRKTSTALRADFHHHVSAVMRQFIADHDWLTVVQLPAYTPELNPTEGVWSHVKRGLGNLAACGIDQLAAIVRTRLKSIQYRPDLIDAFIAETGLAIQPRPP